jgi:glycerol uptake facilitator-like aquaporin
MDEFNQSPALPPRSNSPDISLKPGDPQATQEGTNVTVPRTKNPTRTMEEHGDPLVVTHPDTGAPHLQDQGLDTADEKVDYWAFVKTQLFVVIVGEFTVSIIVGMIMYAALAFAGTNVPLTTGDGTTVLAVGTQTTAAIGIGLATFLGQIAFSRMSGGHFNGAQILGHAISHTFHYFRQGRFTIIFRNSVLVGSAWVSQFAGFLIAAAFILAITGGSKTTDLGVPKLGAVLGSRISQGEGFLVVLANASIYAVVYGLVVIDKAAGSRMNRALSMGLCSVCLSCVFVGLSGACINPWRWLCGSIVLNDYNINDRDNSEGWVFIVAPFLAFGLIMPIGLEIWRRLLEPPPSANMDNDYHNIIAVPEFPPENKYHRHYKEKRMRKGEDHGLGAYKAGIGMRRIASIRRNGISYFRRFSGRTRGYNLHSN